MTREPHTAFQIKFSNIVAITYRNAYYVQGFLSGQRLMRILSIIYLFTLFFDHIAWHAGY